MGIYSLCDAAIESTVPLPDLLPADCREPEFRFSLQSAPAGGSRDSEWFHRWLLPDRTTWLLLGRDDRGYLLRFPALADFSVSNDAKEIRCYADPALPLETIKHLLLDQVIPLILSSRGRLVLHASSIVSPYGAIAFIGQTGWGKSTLAASFGENGFPLITDDCLLVNEDGEQLTATPSYPGLRLWPQTVDALFPQLPALPEVAHYTDKRRLADSTVMPFCSATVPLKRIFFLSPPGGADQAPEIAIERISPRDAFVGLVKFTYVLDITDRLMLGQMFDRLSRLALLPLSYRLSFPRDFSLLPDVQEAILQNLRGNCTS
jgi:hypothetical protein